MSDYFNILFLYIEFVFYHANRNQHFGLYIALFCTMSYQQDYRYFHDKIDSLLQICYSADFILYIVPKILLYSAV